jgi:hypothetical protein
VSKGYLSWMIESIAETKTKTKSKVKN